MSDFLTYKDKPLVRKGNTVYYGDMSEKYIVKLDILSSHTVEELEISDKIRISLIKNDSEKLDNVKKSTQRSQPACPQGGYQPYLYLGSECMPRNQAVKHPCGLGGILHQPQ